MRCVSVVLIFSVVAMASVSAVKEKRKYDLSNAQGLFEDFIKEYNKQYKDDADRDAHYQAFRANLEKINILNEKNPSATYGINNLADYTEEDRTAMFGLRSKSQ